MWITHNYLSFFLVGHLSLEGFKERYIIHPHLYKKACFSCFLFFSKPCLASQHLQKPQSSKNSELFTRIRRSERRPFPGLNLITFQVWKASVTRWKLRKKCCFTGQWCWMTLLCSSLIRLHLFDLILQFQPSIYGPPATLRISYKNSP